MRSQVRRLTVIGALVGICSAVLPAGPAAAATKNPCKLVKPAQISAVFDQPVAKGKKGIKTPVSSSCDFAVALTDTKPEGTVSTYLQFTGAEIAFEVNRDQLTNSESLSGLGGEAFWQPTGSLGGVVWMLKGDVLITVQGVFISIGDAPELDVAQLQDEIVAVAKIARKNA